MDVKEFDKFAEEYFELHSQNIQSYHSNLLDDIWSFDKIHPNDSLAVQNAIGPHIHRHNITIMAQ